MTTIIKIGLVCVRDGRLLVVRKRGAPSFILPGGKPEVDEDDITALRRECREEIQCEVGDLSYWMSIVGPAADLPGTQVEVRAWPGQIVGDPIASAEIDALAWIEAMGSGLQLAPTISKEILPRLAVAVEPRLG